MLWSSLALACCDIHPEEVYEQIQQAYVDDLLYPMIISMRDVDRSLRALSGELIYNLKYVLNYTFIGDVVDELERWDYF
jgi:hypothetical protein